VGQSLHDAPPKRVARVARTRDPGYEAIRAQSFHAEVIG
jgi:hypothetical protein